MSVRVTERTTVIRKARFFTMNSLCQTDEAPSKLTTVPSPLRPGQFGQRTFRVTSRKQSALISYPGIAQRTRRTWLAALQRAFGILYSVLLGLHWIVSPGTSLVTWSSAMTTSPKRSTNPQICPAGDTNKVQWEVMHSKQTRHTFTHKSESPQSLFFFTTFPRQKRDQTDLEEETSFFDPLPWQHQPSLPRAPAHGGSHLLAGSKSGPAALVPWHWAHFTNKVGSSASWLHDMDTCPLSIGLEIRDFHKGQPTAGRQAPPGHCHPGLNWRQRLCV